MKSSQIWHASYPQGVPLEIDHFGVDSIVSILEDAVRKYSDHGAFTCMGTTISYKDLDIESSAFASYLMNVLKLNSGERVALMMPNLLQYPVALFGILKAGLIAVNVNPLYTPRELEHQLKDSGAKAIIVIENFAKTLEAVKTHFPDLHIVTTQVGDLMPIPKRWIINAVTKYVKKMVPAFSLNKTCSFQEAIETGRLYPFVAHPSRKEDIAFLQYTGGTTGVAKGAMLTHGNIMANVRQSGAWISQNFVEGKEVAISPLPLYHIFCLTSMLSFMGWGARNILIPNPRDMKGLVSILKWEPWSILTGVNTLFNGLLNSKGFSECDFSHIKLCLGGGAAVQRSVALAWKSATGQDITEAYGLTETSPGASINPIGAPFKGSIGLPLPSTEISIRSDTFKKLAPWDKKDPVEDHTGEICIRGPQVMKGYWNRPDETAQVMHEDWLMTGDVGHMDAEGFVYITDRKKT